MPPQLGTIVDEKNLLSRLQNNKSDPVVQLVRILACHASGRGFESRPDRTKVSIDNRDNNIKNLTFISLYKVRFFFIVISGRLYLPRYISHDSLLFRARFILTEVTFDGKFSSNIFYLHLVTFKSIFQQSFRNNILTSENEGWLSSNNFHTNFY